MQILPEVRRGIENILTGLFKLLNKEGLPWSALAACKFLSRFFISNKNSVKHPGSKDIYSIYDQETHQGHITQYVYNMYIGSSLLCHRNITPDK